MLFELQRLDQWKQAVGLFLYGSLSRLGLAFVEENGLLWTYLLKEKAHLPLNGAPIAVQTFNMSLLFASVHAIASTTRLFFQHSIQSLSAY